MIASLPSTPFSTESVNTVFCHDGYPLRYRVWPSARPGVANLVLINGMMSHSGWFRDLATRLREWQVNVIGADRRGSGLNENQRGDLQSRQTLISDLVRIIEHEDRRVPTFILGWCWGALPAILLCLELGNRLGGLTLLAPGLFPSNQIKRAAGMELGLSPGPDIDCPTLRSPLTAAMFSDQASIQQCIFHDSLAQRLFTRRFFQITAEMSLMAAGRLSQLSLPVLLLLAAHDVTVDNQCTLRAFSRLRHTVLTSATLTCNHGMHFEAPRAIVMYVTTWLVLQGVQVQPPARSHR